MDRFDVSSIHFVANRTKSVNFPCPVLKKRARTLKAAAKTAKLAVFQGLLFSLERVWGQSHFIFFLKILWMLIVM